MCVQRGTTGSDEREHRWQLVMKMQGADQKRCQSSSRSDGGKAVIRRIPGYTTDGPSGFRLEPNSAGRILEWVA